MLNSNKNCSSAQLAQLLILDRNRVAGGAGSTISNTDISSKYFSCLSLLPDPLYVCDATAQVCPGLPASLCVRRNFMLHTDLACWVGRSLCVAVTSTTVLYTSLCAPVQSHPSSHIHTPPPPPPPTPTTIITHTTTFSETTESYFCLLTDKNVWCDLADSTEESRGVTQRNVMTEAVRAQEAV